MPISSRSCNRIEVRSDQRGTLINLALLQHHLRANNRRRFNIRLSQAAARCAQPLATKLHHDPLRSTPVRHLENALVAGRIPIVRRATYEHGVVVVGIANQPRSAERSDTRTRLF